MSLAGTFINDRYQLDEPVASGGEGQLWRATDRTLGRSVAVKLVRPRHLDDANGARFLAEARAMAAVLHPSLATIYDYGQTRTDDGATTAFLVRAWITGQPLADRIAEAGRLDAAETATVVSQIGRALQAMHDAGAVHGDLHPADLLIEPDGQVVLVDPGVGVPTHREGSESDARAQRTAGYAAPELAAGPPATPAADVYALGAVAYHCLAGHPPVLGDGLIAAGPPAHGRDVPPLPADVPAGLRRLVATAMATDPADRFPTADAMAEAAEADAESRGVAESRRRVALRAPTRADSRPDSLTAAPTAVAASPASGGRPSASRRGRVAFATALACLAALAAVFAFTDPLGGARPPAGRLDAPRTTTSPASAVTSGPGGGTGGEQSTTTSEPIARPSGGNRSGPPVGPGPGGGTGPIGSSSSPQPTPPADPTPPSSDEPSPPPSPSPSPDGTTPAASPEQSPAAEPSPGSDQPALTDP